MTVFICYGKEDETDARRLRTELIGARFEVWFDKDRLVGGQKWDEAIVKAIRSADVVCAVLSRSSVSRQGFVNKEIREALKVVDELPESRPFLIPVRLEECESSLRQLSELHRVDMFPDWNDGRRQLLKALRLVEGISGGTNSLPARAFVQIRLGEGPLGDTIAAVKRLPGVVSVDATFGHYDMMVVLDASKNDDLAERVERLHEIAGVGSTSTHVIVPRR
jgi:DNA-binding Lrp family transcriptional regulator